MKVKKILSVALALTMVLSASAFAEGTVSVGWNDTDSTQVDVMENYIQPALAEAFPDYEFEYLGVEENFAGTYQTLAATGDLPDIWYNGGDTVQTLVESGDILDMLPILGEDWVSEHFKNPDQLYYNGGFYYMAPGQNAYYTPVFYYNKYLFDEYGFEEPKNIDELVEICQTFKDNGITPITMAAWQSSACLISVLLEMTDPQALYDLTDGTINWDDEGVVEALKYFDTLKLMGAFTTDVNMKDDAAALAEFQNGEAAMWLCYSWMNDSVTEESLGFVPGVFSPPAAEGEEYVQLHWDPRKGLGGGYCANANSEFDSEVLVEMLKVIIQAESQRHNDAGVSTNYIVEKAAVPSNPLEVERLEQYDASTKKISVLFQGAMDAPTLAEWGTLFSMLISDDADYLSEQFIEELVPIWEENTVANG